MFELEAKEREFPTRAENARVRARTMRPTILMDSLDEYRVKSSATFGRHGGTDFTTSYYRVRFFLSSGKLFVDCECEAGVQEFPCKHIYAAKEKRDQAAKRTTPKFVKSSFTVEITPDTVVVSGITTDSIYARTEINHRRSVRNGEQVLQKILDVVKNAR
jgi:hypothetical protein